MCFSLVTVNQSNSNGMMNVVRRWDSIFQGNLPEPRGPPQSFEAHKFLKMLDFLISAKARGTHSNKC